MPGIVASGKSRWKGLEFKANRDFLARPCLKKQNKTMKLKTPLRNSPSDVYVLSLPLSTPLCLENSPVHKTCQAMASLLPNRYVCLEPWCPGLPHCCLPPPECELTGGASLGFPPLIPSYPQGYLLDLLLEPSSPLTL